MNSISSQTGRVAIITGANSGIGFESALELAKKDVEVILACRSLDKAHRAANAISENYPGAKTAVIKLDTSSLSSVREFSEEFLSKYSQLDILVNNAGIMMPPYSKTEEGFESQFATNYLGHFLLTGMLLKSLEKTQGSRVVTVSSLAHKWGDLYFDDLGFERKYDAKRAYGQSKLACLMFAYELQRKFKAKKYQTKSLAVHPGISYTNLFSNTSFLIRKSTEFLTSSLFQDAAQGALPTLAAALDPTFLGGEYIGPGGFQEFRGKPKVVTSNKNSRNKQKAQMLWERSEKLTGYTYFQ